jgi:predicted pyridoxine 5'-phosphate oxidase superfamily flavin-nucleotide-binding protein
MQDDSQTDVYHNGEVTVQRQAGVREKAEKVSQMVRETIPESDNVKQLLAAEPHVVVTSLAPDGDVWVSLLAAEPGFLSIEDDRRLRVGTEPVPGDPLADHLRDGMPVGVLVMDPRNRERIRFNGTASPTDEGFIVKTQEVFPNCQKYIQQRSFERVTDLSNDGRRENDSLVDTQREWIRSADTFFIGSYYPETGADASHRGGEPGFVTVDGDTLVFPDYPGNNMFCTLGNIEGHGAVGLLFVDFEEGRTLQLTGRGNVVWDDRRVSAFEGAERLVEIEVESAIELPEGNPLRWELEEHSPYLPS